MNPQHTKLVRLSSDVITLSKQPQQTNLNGSISIYNIADINVAVKIKSNNPTQYIVSPSQVILSPTQKAKIIFKKNINSLNKISFKADKFQFIIVEVDQSQIQMIQNQPKVDDSIFFSKDKKMQKEILDVEFGSNQMLGLAGSSSSYGILNTGLGESHTKLKSSPTQAQSLLRNSTLRTSYQSNSNIQTGWNINNQNDTNKYQKTNPSLTQSQSKYQMSPQFSRNSIFDKDKVYKQEYERLIQKVHEYEKNFQQLDQEIKITRNEKEKWNQIQNVGKKETLNQGYEAWNVILVILIFMFIGTLFAK